MLCLRYVFTSLQIWRVHQKGLCNIYCIHVGGGQDELNETLVNPSYRGVAYVYVTAYWAALLGSFHLVATAPSAPPALAILGEWVGW